MTLKQKTKFIKALANERRLDILQFLKTHKQASVGEISDGIKLSYKSTSSHLQILLIADILTREQKSPEAEYSLRQSQEPIVSHLLKL